METSESCRDPFSKGLKPRSHPHLVWPNGRMHAVTSSWDDGPIHDRRLAALLDKYGMRATFCLNSTRLLENGKGNLTPGELKSVFANHEVAIHGPDHPCATRIPQLAWLQDALVDRARLEEWTGRIIRGASWPFGSFGPISTQALATAGIVYCRALELQIEGKTETWLLPEREQWYAWRPGCFYREVVEKPDRFESFRRTKKVATLYNLWGHSWDLENDGTWEAFEAWCAKVGSDHGIWHATYIDIYDYLEAWRSLQWSASLRRVYNPTSRELWITRDGIVSRIPAGQIAELE